MEMGEKIYNLRKAKGLTLEELGNLVGVGKSTVRTHDNCMTFYFLYLYTY